MPATRRATEPAYTAALTQPVADKRIEILRQIGASGSISQAGRAAGVSYKAAWQAIETLTNLAGVALVERVVGGAGGGGARLTVAGAQLLMAADELELARRQVLARLQSAQPGLPQLSIRTSMRNQLPCRVVALQGEGRIMRVGLSLADGTGLDSRITQESAELLGLAPGLPVLALCKATAVGVHRPGEAPASIPGRNLLPARASRVSRDAGGDEVVAALGAGLHVVGFASAASGLRVGGRVVVAIDASALVIALAG